ncbi:hypothetical protein CHS0354_035139 [Potamilus streckersoni]|uniref:Cytochrome P450 n=1 Tax=Potamilus streckersoni TaxID=2493646 RepID=A0AAE0WBL3_9BIVA|nr:hypothetical protein CHS0354_035139 [Potamilus streckersoni]
MVTFVLLLAAITALAFWYLRWHFSTFKRLGLQGPEPSIIAGNLPEIMKKGQLQAMIDWSKQYGRVFGYYEGWTPVIAVADPKILRQILVKDFDNFRSRKPFPLAPRKALGLFLENGHQWKQSRSILTPAFSTGKIKKMFPVIDSMVDNLEENIKVKSAKAKPFDIYRYDRFRLKGLFVLDSIYQGLTLDVIGRCAFGLQTNAQTDPKDEFLTNIRFLFSGLSKTCILYLVMLIPIFQYFVFALKNLVIIFGMNPVVWLRNQLREIIRIRKEMGSSHNAIDLVQLMLFPSTKYSTGAEKQRSMTDREIVAQSLTFLLAGYETTSAVLSFLTDLLSRNKEVQDRLCAEIDGVIRDGHVDYDNVQQLPYFDMVINEVCRLYPTASLIVTRQAAESRIYNGVHIPAGMAIQANVWALHHDGHFWQNPEAFIPERFSPTYKEKIVPYSFLPFGVGPRSCIGERFAMLEIKLTIARILKNYRFTRPHDSDSKHFSICDNLDYGLYRERCLVNVYPVLSITFMI